MFRSRAYLLQTLPTIRILTSTQTPLQLRLISSSFSSSSSISNSSPSSTMPPPPPPPPPNTAITNAPKSKSSSKPQSLPRLSSSLLLLSATNQVLLVQRSSSKSMSFSSAIVFPGGNLDPAQDAFLIPASSPQLPLPKALPPGKEELDIPVHLETALKTCAIRETFEETGVLFAYPANTPACTNTAAEIIPQTSLRSARTSLLSNHPSNPNSNSTLEESKQFSKILRDLGLRIDADELHPFTTWITPPNLPKRYRTSMFLAFLPLDSPPILLDEPTSDGSGGEIAQARWMHPRDILNLYHAQSKSTSSSTFTSAKPRLILFPPQYFLLTHLASSIKNHPSSHAAAREDLMSFVRYQNFSRQVIQPYTKKVLGEVYGVDNGKVLLGIDRPRGDGNRWVKLRFGKDGPRELELVKRWEAEEETLAKEGGMAKL